MRHYINQSDVKQCLIFFQVYSLAPFLSLGAFFEGRLPGSDREEKVYLMMVIFELNDAPWTPDDGFSHAGMNKYAFRALLSLLHVILPFRFGHLRAEKKAVDHLKRRYLRE